MHNVLLVDKSSSQMFFWTSIECCSLYFMILFCSITKQTFVHIFVISIVTIFTNANSFDIIFGSIEIVFISRIAQRGNITWLFHQLNICYSWQCWYNVYFADYYFDARDNKKVSFKIIHYHLLNGAASIGIIIETNYGWK